MDISIKNIGNRIRERRKELKLTQTDIYHECGITSGALSQIENGNRVPSAIAFYFISQVLNCSMEYLITGKISETKKLNIFGNEKMLLDGFRELSTQDKEELIEILEVKLRKIQKETNTKFEFIKKDIDLLPEEQKLLDAYRLASPGIQDATRKLLDMPEQETNSLAYEIGKKAI